MRPITDEVKEFISDVQAVVEATTTERQLLWETKSLAYPLAFPRTNLDAYNMDHRYLWEEILYGYLVTVNNNTKKPICIPLTKAKVDGVTVLFWHPTSNYVNYTQIEKWLDIYLPRDEAIRTDAMNFSHIFYAKEKNKSEVAEILT